MYVSIFYLLQRTTGEKESHHQPHWKIMEGLLPMVYKSIKKNRTRRQYQYLSSSSAATAQSYNDIPDFCNNNNHQEKLQYGNNIDQGFFVTVEGMTHRRRNSIQVDYLGRHFSPDHHAAAAANNSRKLVRFSSHRFFSCVSGA